MVRLADTVDPQLDVIVSTIVALVRPELVLLFGSRANIGDRQPRADSDYDLMIVLGDDTDVGAARSAAYDALLGARITADVLTRTVSDYQRRQHDPGCLEWLVARQGRLLYTSGAIEKTSAPPRVRERSTEGEREWLRRSDADYQAMTVLSSSEPQRTSVADAICFHAHACIEKLLKALLAHTGTFPPRTHELPRLLQALAPDIRDHPEIVAACTILHKLYPQSRYPELPMPTVDEARRAVSAAETARRHLRALL